MNQTNQNDKVPMSSSSSSSPKTQTFNTTDYINSMKAPSLLNTTDYINSMKQPAAAAVATINLCGKRLADGKYCQSANIGGCANSGCSSHYGWPDEVEGFRLRTF